MSMIVSKGIATLMSKEQAYLDVFRNRLTTLVVKYRTQQISIGKLMDLSIADARTDEEKAASLALVSAYLKLSSPA